MFRFSIDRDTPVDTNPSQLATAGVTEDRQFAENLGDDHRDDERYYRAENETPADVREAVGFVRGLFFHVPARVWLDGALHEIDADDYAAADKPTT